MVPETLLGAHVSVPLSKNALRQHHSYERSRRFAASRQPKYPGVPTLDSGLRRTSGAHCDQGVMLNDLRGDNGDMKETTAEQVRDKSSCEKKLHNGDAADENYAREENRVEGQLPKKDARWTPAAAVAPATAEADGHAQHCVERWTRCENGQPPPPATVPQVHGTVHEVEEATVTIPHGL